MESSHFTEHGIGILMESFHQQSICMKKQTVALRIVYSYGTIRSKGIVCLLVIIAIFSGKHVPVDCIRHHHPTENLSHAGITVVEKRITSQLFSLIGQHRTVILIGLTRYGIVSSLFRINVVGIAPDIRRADNISYLRSRIVT